MTLRSAEYTPRMKRSMNDVCTTILVAMGWESLNHMRVQKSPLRNRMRMSSPILRGWMVVVCNFGTFSLFMQLLHFGCINQAFMSFDTAAMWRRHKAMYIALVSRPHVIRHMYVSLALMAKPNFSVENGSVCDRWMLEELVLYYE